MELELARLKRELAEVKLERDLLKKAAAYIWTSPIAQDESSL
jgi:transposase-like protein